MNSAALGRTVQGEDSLGSFSINVDIPVLWFKENKGSVAASGDFKIIGWEALPKSGHSFTIWKKHYCSTSSKRDMKINTLLRAAKLFELNADEAEALAIKAGFSLAFERPFRLRGYLNFHGKVNELCQCARIRMFEHMYAGRYIRKETLLALLIALNY